MTDPHSKCDRCDQRSLLSFFAKKICPDESQDRSKASIEDNVSIKNDISASVHNGNNSKDL